MWINALKKESHERGSLQVTMETQKLALLTGCCPEVDLVDKGVGEGCGREFAAGVFTESLLDSVLFLGM